MRRLAIISLLLLCAATVYASYLDNKAEPASSDHSGCAVERTAATCEGNWDAVQAIPNPGAITELELSQMNGQQPSLAKFSVLKIVAAEDTALNIKTLPQTVTKVGIIGSELLVADPARTLEQLFLIGDGSTVERIMNQPASSITALITAKQVNLNPLNELTVDKLVVKVSHPTRPKINLDGYENELSNFREHKVITDPFTKATSSELTINRTARR